MDLGVFVCPQQRFVRKDLATWGLNLYQGSSAEQSERHEVRGGAIKNIPGDCL